MNFIIDFMGQDHGYLEKLLEKYLAQSYKSKKSQQFFKRFQDRLKLHIQLEDEYLFVRLNRSLFFKDKSALTDRIIQEHQDIMKLIARLQAAIRGQSAKKVTVFQRHLSRALRGHMRREMKLYYPVSNSFIPPAEWTKMLLKVYGVGLLVINKSSVALKPEPKIYN